MKCQGDTELSLIINALDINLIPVKDLPVPGGLHRSNGRISSLSKTYKHTRTDALTLAQGTLLE
jgi:hypothetical protein